MVRSALGTERAGDGSAENSGAGARALRTLRQWLRTGRLAPGEWVPSERALSDSLRVSRMTLRQALETLEASGEVEREGRRRYVPAQGKTRRVLDQTIAVLANGPGAPIRWASRSAGHEAMIELGVLYAISEAGHHALTLTPDRLVGDALDTLVADRPRGVVALRRATECEAGREMLEALRASGVAVAVYGDVASMPGFDTVVSDHASGSRAVAQWLIDCGCRRVLRAWSVVPLDGRPPEWLRQRDAGYERAVREAGLPVLPAVEIPATGGDPETNSLDHLARVYAGYLVEHLSGAGRVDAIMTASDGQIFAVAAACRLLGIDPQRDLLIAGYDNYWSVCPELAHEPTSPAVTVDKRNDVIGRTLVELLDARVLGQLPSEPQTRVVRPELVVLQSEHAGKWSPRKEEKNES